MEQRLAVIVENCMGTDTVEVFSDDFFLPVEKKNIITEYREEASSPNKIPQTATSGVGTIFCSSRI